ncbi:MAG: hybrid sensor histidine kinase/response regulator [Chrysiogenetes bacterium]|nr:hybrid sensor histidine kinase/response regulator [Chrysiogenetes bacterium]
MSTQTDHPRILYIEDNDDNRMLVRKLLEREGFEVLEALDGLSGIEAAQREKPDLILMDLNLPFMGGNEAATRLKSTPALADTPVVAISANVLKGDKERSLAAGCDGFIEKPIDVETFPDEVRKFLGGHRESLAESANEPEYLRQYTRELVDHLERELSALQTANSRLKEMDRLKDEFLRNLSHELRTPLTPMRGYLECLSTGDFGPLTGEQQSAVSAITKAYERLKMLIENLLAFAGLEAGRITFHHTSWSVEPLLKEVADARRADAQARGVEVLMEGPVERVELVADRQRLCEVLEHLLDNAIKFTPKGGTVKLSARAFDGDMPGIELSEAGLADLDPSRRYVALSVSDTGIGIAPEVAESIFQDFYQVDGAVNRRFEGVGLGLSISRRIVEAHGGKIGVASRPDEGSTFYVVIPLLPR